MAWNINYNSENKIIELEYINIVTPEELQSVFEATFKLSTEKNCFLVLTDCRELKGGHTLFDLLSIIDQIKDIGGLSEFKEAIILPPEQIPADNVEFWETACRNRGINVKVFEDSENAVKWLKS